MLDFAKPSVETILVRSSESYSWLFEVYRFIYGVFMEQEVKFYTQGDFYTDEDLAFCENEWPAEEVEKVFSEFRNAIDIADHKTMASMVAPGGRAGNATFGLFDDQKQYLEFLKMAWHELIPNHSVWHVIDRGRIVNKWRESLPGLDGEGKRYDYFGINELIYAGNGLFNLQYSIPDIFGLTGVYQKWKTDGRHEEYGEIYPGLGEM
jgi:hypothetical protein